MSISVRLAKIGKKNSHAFKVVVSNTKDKRNGKFLDILGYFNPLQKEPTFLDKTKLEEWKKKGAIITKAVEQLSDGTYKFVKYSPNSKNAEKQA